MKTGAMQQIWSVINGLQLFVHMPVLSVPLPDTSQEFLSELINIATLEIIPSHLFYDNAMEVPEEDEDLLN